MTTTKTSRTVRTKVYKFAGLSKEAQKKAIEWYQRTLDGDSEILFGFEDHCQERAAETGFTDIKVQYSLSSCQGDGLSFSGLIDIERFAKETYPNIKQSVLSVLKSYCNANLTGNTGRYCFASTCDVDFSLEARKDYPNIEKMVSEIQATIENAYMNLCRELERTGYDWIDDAYTDESAISNIEANEYEFLKDGTRSPF